jgi:protein-S-isoprenylcysteine O-methyltransferase Ste14
VLFSSLALMLLFWQWRAIPTAMWQVTDPQIASVILGVAFVGWLIVLTSTFLINHFEPFGLHQVANNLAGRPMPAPRFRTPLYYKFVRHPIYLGFIIAFWAAPTMTVGHLLFAAVTRTSSSSESCWKSAIWSISSATTTAAIRIVCRCWCPGASRPDQSFSGPIR